MHAHTHSGWVISLKDIPGDQPLMEATLTAQKEGLTDAKVHVRPYEDGGVLMGPIGVDYMHRAVTETNVQVLVDQSVAD